MKTVNYLVKRSYTAAYPESLVIRQGTRIRFERKPTEWPGWIWCTVESGKSAWVPEAWVEINGNCCVLKRDYDSRELTVQPGDALEVVFTESGWGWVRNREGREGWVPLDRIDPR